MHCSYSLKSLQQHFGPKLQHQEWEGQYVCGNSITHMFCQSCTHPNLKVHGFPFSLLSNPGATYPSHCGSNFTIIAAFQKYGSRPPKGQLKTSNETSVVSWRLAMGLVSWSALTNWAEGPVFVLIDPMTDCWACHWQQILKCSLRYTMNSLAEKCLYWQMHLGPVWTHCWK